jgi:hypothetical protein
MADLKIRVGCPVIEIIPITTTTTTTTTVPENTFTMDINPVSSGSGAGSGIVNVGNAPFTFRLEAFGGATPGGSTVGHASIDGGIGDYDTPLASVGLTTYIDIIIPINGIYNIILSGTFIGTSGNTVNLV